MDSHDAASAANNQWTDFQGTEMHTKRLELSLERLQPSDWNRFERLASVFLASEFDELHTVASSSGDEGRDAELFSPASESIVVLQYSVSKDWKAKVNATVRRLKVTIPNALVLIYVTNQVIGADSDSIKKALRTKQGLTLDVRDRHWFLDRVLGSPARQMAAEELACVIVDPLLPSVGVGPHVQAELSSSEAIAAVTFLGLQWQDETRDKGLTKLAFEALVRAALVNTDSQNRAPRSVIHERVHQILPDHALTHINALVDAALRRLTKHTVKHWPKEDEFCLANDEVIRFNKFRVCAALAESSLLASIHGIANMHIVAMGISIAHESEFTRCLRSAADAILFERSQAFAMAVQTGGLAELANTDFRSTLISEIAKSSLPKLANVDWVALLRAGVREVLISSDSAIQAYLRTLADSYTLLAFLKQTPDVQGAVEKMFSDGMLWLDATIVLPLVADTLAVADGESGRFTRMIDAARDAGLSLFVTPGIVEEVERHMNRALTCVRLANSQWEGSIPYLLERYVACGRSPSGFNSWLENFRGDSRPIQDISEYLKDQFGITTRSLEAECNASSDELRHALQLLWLERYKRRQELYGSHLDEMAISRLVSHDIECYCGIVQLRSKESAAPFGHSAWWLTVDKQTFDLKNKLRLEMKLEPPNSPVMSADFLVNYLAFGPIRRRINKSKEAHLPLMMALGNASHLTPELLAEAEGLRAQHKDLPERVIRRKVRDYLDRARSRIGPIANMGMDEVEDIFHNL